MQTVFENKASKTLVFYKNPRPILWLANMVEKFSKAKTSMLKTDLNFLVKIKVVGNFKIYNFHEENFSKFGTDLQEKNRTL